MSVLNHAPLAGKLPGLSGLLLELEKLLGVEDLLLVAHDNLLLLDFFTKSVITLAYSILKFIWYILKILQYTYNLNYAKFYITYAGKHKRF